MRDDGRNQPPRWIDRLLEWFCADEFLEIVQGDLHELYRQNVAEYGKQKADSQYLLDVLSLFRPFALGFTLPDLFYLTSSGMFTNYFTTSIRNLRKNRLYAFINTLGLAIAMAVVLLIAVFVSYDLSFDDYAPNNSNIYRHTVELVDSDFSTAKTFPGLGPYLLDNYGPVEEFTRIYPTPDVGSVVAPFPEEDRKFIELDTYYAEDNVFDFFFLPLIIGYQAECLNEPNQVLLSSELAVKYFGKNWQEQDLLGHTIQITNFGNEDTKQYALTGIYQKKPNSHFRPDLMMSISSLPKNLKDRLIHNDWPDAYTYLKFQHNTDLEQTKLKIDNYLFENAWGKDKRWKFDTKLQQLSEIHHISRYKDEMEAGSDVWINYFLIGVAVFIMVCAWVNYINMAVAKSLKRAKEVGVRKTLGAHRWNIILQFLYEGLWLNLLSGLLAILIAYLALPYLNLAYPMEANGWPLQLWIDGIPQVLPFITLVIFMILFGTLISGIYPALMLSSYRPVRVLRGIRLEQKGNLGLRQSLLVVQFVISALLMVGIFAAYFQVNYMLNKDLGFEKEQKLVVSTAVSDINSVDNYMQHADNFRDEIKGISGVQQVTSASSVPSRPPGGKLILSKFGSILGESGTETIYNAGPTEGIVVGPGFFEFYNMELAAGRWFPPQVFKDTILADQYLLVNEQFAKSNGFEPLESILEKIVYVVHYQKDNKQVREPRKIIGVVKNHHHFSVKEAYQPMVYSPENARVFTKLVDHKVPHQGALRYFSLKLNLEDQPNQQIKYIIGQVEEAWQKHLPALAFDYFFLDDAFNQQYATDVKISQLFSIFGILSIFISCLGLFGLSSYLIQQRTKEIGIRKVLGASLRQLFSLLSANYIRLVLIASVIAVPIGWWGIKQWLDNYAFRVVLQWWFFVLPLLGLLSIALLTISFKVIRSAKANPVDSLRYE